LTLSSPWQTTLKKNTPSFYGTIIKSETCFHHSKKFVAELPLYSAKELKDHDTLGELIDGGVNSSLPHVSCPFCHLKLFDEIALQDHLDKNYFSCSYCKPKERIYYKDLISMVVF
jgi:hypothetical protein